MPTIEETIRRLDVPPPTPQNVELTVYLLLGVGSGRLSGSRAGKCREATEDDIRVQRLSRNRYLGRQKPRQTAVPCQGLARLDTDIPNPSTYSFGYSGCQYPSDEKGRSIRLDGLRFNANIWSRTQQTEGNVRRWIRANSDAGFGTDVDVREGQKVVVGKAAIGGTNSALILVITAKVLE